MVVQIHICLINLKWHPQTLTLCLGCHKFLQNLWSYFLVWQLRWKFLIKTGFLLLLYYKLNKKLFFGGIQANYNNNKTKKKIVKKFYERFTFTRLKISNNRGKQLCWRFENWFYYLTRELFFVLLLFVLKWKSFSGTVVCLVNRWKKQFKRHQKTGNVLAKSFANLRPINCRILSDFCSLENINQT